MPTSITSSGITFDDATTQTTSATKAGGIGTTQLADSSVTTAKINNATITAAKLDGAQTGSAPIYGCRAWVNFNGSADATGAASTANTNRLIRASGNVTSVLRNGAGDYTVTFSTPMPDANYAAIVTGDMNFSAIFGAGPLGALSAASLRVGTQSFSTGAAGDRGQVFVAIFR